ncbi:MAG: type II secretion system F family protein [Alphaproteobacteria bacterium]|nr:type II secretion system F family protein [Alphaproteobacteria bacterium]
MLLYKYTAISSDGEKISGSVFAEDYKDAYKTIYLRKKHPLSIVQIPTVSSEKISLEDLLLFFLHIDLQLKCKVKINDAIESFLELHGNQVLKTSLAAILIDLNSGVSLGEAFEKCNKVFGSVIIGLLRSAEQTGKISDIISNILKFLKLKSEWKNNIKRAIAYPIFVVFIAICVLIFSIMFLGPQIISLIQNIEGSHDNFWLTFFIAEYLPHFLEYTIYFVPIFLLLAFLFLVNKKARFVIMNFILRIPSIGPLIIKTNFWQVCKILHIALNAKLDFLSALNLAIDSINIENIRNEIVNARDKIIEGYSISDAFSNTKFISKSAISAIDIGEESNDLSTSFASISDNQYEEIILDIKMLGQSLSIGLTLFTGAVFILIICGLFFPIYSYVEIAGM